MFIEGRQFADKLCLFLTVLVGFPGVKVNFCTKKGLPNAAFYGIVDMSAGDDDWVPCGAML